MLSNILGVKIGMTQLFDEKGEVVPVTVIDTNNIVITQIKSQEQDGYAAVQLGLLRKRFQKQAFSALWLQKKPNYFLKLKEVSIASNGLNDNDMPGKALSLTDIDIHIGGKVTITGTSKGLGFQGVVKRWGFSGGPSAHGSKFHRKPGSSGHLRRQGEIIKGKKFPGHAGCAQVTVKGLKIIRIDSEQGYLFVKGAVPGKPNSIVLIKKEGN